MRQGWVVGLVVGCGLSGLLFLSLSASPFRIRRARSRASRRGEDSSLSLSLGLSLGLGSARAGFSRSPSSDLGLARHGSSPSPSRRQEDSGKGRQAFRPAALHGATPPSHCAWGGRELALGLPGAKRAFRCEHAGALQSLGLLDSDEDWAMPTELRPALLTGSSANHFAEARTGVLSAQRRFPNASIVFYDFGLEPGQAEEVASWCGVELVRFPFADFPPSVRRLSEYRWKALAIALGLRRFPAVWWTDTSIRWDANVSLAPLYGEMEKGRRLEILAGQRLPYTLVDRTGHSVWAATHPATYAYLGGEEEGLARAEMHGGGFALAVRSPLTRDLLKWYVLCSLTEDCMAPEGAQLSCRFRGEKMANYAGCHRYDQSAINVLLARLSGYETRAYVPRAPQQPPFAKVDRTADLHSHPLRCCAES